MNQKYKNVSQFSRASFQKFQSSGRRVTITNQILVLLEFKPMTGAELRLSIGCGQSSVCNPLKTLCDNGRIQKIGSKYDNDTGREVTLYGLAPLEAPTAPDILPQAPNYGLQSKLFDNEPFQ